MADAVVSVVIEQLISIIRAEVDQEVRLVAGVRKEVKKLTDTLTIIQRVLKSADEMQVKYEDVKIWLEQLNEICYDADDVLDEWSTRMIISQIQRCESNAPIGKKVCQFLASLFSSCKHIFVKKNIAHRIKEIREQLDEVASKKDQFKLFENPPQVEISRPIISSLVDLSEIYGRDEDTRIIVSKLLTESSHRDMHAPVISIVGTAGFGKTALAQLVIKDEQVVNSFQKIMWVCVSVPYDRERVAKEIILQAVGNMHVPDGWDAVHKILCDSVRDKVFLVVLDDVWTFDDKTWRDLRFALDGGDQGSRILVTTRDETVAMMMGSRDIHRLQQLSDGDCWSLFRHISFRERYENLESLEVIGKQIAKKCKGVPLAARILAGLMCLKRTAHDWKDVLESDIWEVMSVSRNGVLPELCLSYDALPSNLKQCFMYCAVFKKDVEIKKDELVKLWMAHGFLGSDGTESLEAKGASFFYTLAMRSFFQDFRMDRDGNLIGCKMHDLVHDFSQFLAVRGRHLSASNFYSLSISNNINLRTLRPLDSFWVGTPPLNLFNQLTCLRALDLTRCKLQELPAEVGRLLHLRYLDLSRTRLKKLPEAVCKLLNMQTLRLKRCSHLTKLPEGIGALFNLRHLEIEETTKLRYFPRSIGRLCSLRTLNKFIVVGENEGCKIEDLKNLKHLQGSLQISGLEQVMDVDETVHAELKLKENLRSLELVFTEEYLIQDARRIEIVLVGLEPHQDLEELNIHYYPGAEFPSWLSSLRNLVKLKLYRCRDWLQLPCLGKLAYLEVLDIQFFSSVTHIGDEFYGLDNVCSTAFPMLKKLYVDGMENLQVWELPVSENGSIMPRLSDLMLRSFGNLRKLPALGNLESLESLSIESFSKVKRVGRDFLGERSSIFPKLKELSFTDMEDWEEWDDISLHKVKDSFPLLCSMQIVGCLKLKELPALGRLKSLEYLRLERLKSLIHLGVEFLGISPVSDGGGGSAQHERVLVFPKLKKLEFVRMDGWKEWVLPFRKDIDIFPELAQLELFKCRNLHAFPALGRLKSLGTLSVKDVGLQFLGISDINSGEPVAIFPKLKLLVLQNLHQWVKWDLPMQKGMELFPQLRELRLEICRSLQVLPALGKLKSPRTLVLKKLVSVARLGNEFLGISSDTGSLEDGEEGKVVFPQLANLTVRRMDAWEEPVEMLALEKDQRDLTTIMPCLHNLEVSGCSKLKMVPHYMLSHEMRYLNMYACPALTGMQPCLPPFLEEIHLTRNVGVFSTSLSIIKQPGNNYPNLKVLDIVCSHSSLPDGFDQLTAVQKLKITGYNAFVPEDLRHLTMLQEVEINCLNLNEYCRKREGWSKLVQIPKIIILKQEIPFT